MNTVICKVYDTKKDDKYVFPEIEENLVDSTKPALCISGGGCRSITAAFGFFRSILKRDPNYLERFSYASGSSGGAWILILLSIIKEDIFKLIGRDIPLNEISMQTLRSVNFDDEDTRFLGYSVYNFPVLNFLSQALRNGLPNNKCYQYILGEVFLRVYGVKGKTIVADKHEAELNEYHNGIKCEYPRKKFPFLISSATVMDEETQSHGSRHFEFTPMYSGMRVKTHLYGGMYFQNQGLGCYKQHIKLNSLNRLKVRKYSGDSCVESFMAYSGAAYAQTAVSGSHGSIFMGLLESLIPSINLWSDKQDNDIVPIGDAGFVDNTGILSLVARGVPKILALNTTKGIKDHISETNLTCLFGIDCPECSTNSYTRNSQIFRSEDWEDVENQLKTRIHKGGCVYIHKKLEVLKNDFVGVNGGYEVELLVIYYEKHKDFDRILPDSFNEILNRSLGPYPTYNFMMITPESILGMSKEQINMMSTYCSWYTDQMMDIIEIFMK